MQRTANVLLCLLSTKALLCNLPAAESWIGQSVRLDRLGPNSRSIWSNSLADKEDQKVEARRHQVELNILSKEVFHHESVPGGSNSTAPARCRQESGLPSPGVDSSLLELCVLFDFVCGLFGLLIPVFSFQ